VKISFESLLFSGRTKQRQKAGSLCAYCKIFRFKEKEESEKFWGGGNIEYVNGDAGLRTIKIFF